MSSKFFTLVAAGALALSTTVAFAQSGAPSNENDRSGQPTDSSQNSAKPRPGANQGSGNMGSGNVGGGTAGQGSTQDRTPVQPGGVSPSAPPQSSTDGGGASSQPRPR